MMLNSRFVVFRVGASTTKCRAEGSENPSPATATTLRMKFRPSKAKSGPLCLANAR